MALGHYLQDISNHNEAIPLPILSKWLIRHIHYQKRQLVMVDAYAKDKNKKPL
jgi:hypothetical protein